MSKQLKFSTVDLIEIVVSVRYQRNRSSLQEPKSEDTKLALARRSFQLQYPMP